MRPIRFDVGDFALATGAAATGAADLSDCFFDGIGLVVAFATVLVVFVMLALATLWTLFGALFGAVIFIGAMLIHTPSARFVDDPRSLKANEGRPNTATCKNAGSRIHPHR